MTVSNAELVQKSVLQMTSSAVVENAPNGNTQETASPASHATTTAPPEPSDMETVLSTKASIITNGKLLQYEEDFSFDADSTHEH